VAVCVQIAYCVQVDIGNAANRKITLYNERLQIFVKNITRQKIMGVNMAKTENIIFDKLKYEFNQF